MRFSIIVANLFAKSLCAPAVRIFSMGLNPLVMSSNGDSIRQSDLTSAMKVITDVTRSMDSISSQISTQRGNLTQNLVEGFASTTTQHVNTTLDLVDHSTGSYSHSMAPAVKNYLLFSMVPSITNNAKTFLGIADASGQKLIGKQPISQLVSAYQQFASAAGSSNLDVHQLKVFTEDLEKY